MERRWVASACGIAFCGGLPPRSKRALGLTFVRFPVQAVLLAGIADEFERVLRRGRAVVSLCGTRPRRTRPLHKRRSPPVRCGRCGDSASRLFPPPCQRTTARRHSSSAESAMENCQRRRGGSRRHLSSCASDASRRTLRRISLNRVLVLYRIAEKRSSFESGPKIAMSSS